MGKKKTIDEQKMKDKQMNKLEEETGEVKKDKEIL